MRTPAWAKGEEQPLLEAAGHRLQDDVRRERLNVRGLIGVHSDRDIARTELSEEERTRKPSRPKTRRFRQLEKHDAEIDRLTLRLTDASRQLQEAEARLAAAPDDDARSLADWLAGGERGPRPEASMYERTRDRDAAQLYVTACGVELDEKLEQRQTFILQHRKKMLADVHKDVEQAQAQLSEAVSRLPVLRQQLLDCRESVLWLASYPDAVQTWAFPSAACLGLQEPARQTLHTTARVEHHDLIALLHADAEALATRFSVDQRRKMGEDVDAQLTPLGTAMWSGDERAKAWGKAELERAREIANYAVDPHALASEVKDLRPDPPDR